MKLSNFPKYIISLSQVCKFIINFDIGQISYTPKNFNIKYAGRQDYVESTRGLENLCRKKCEL